MKDLISAKKLTALLLVALLLFGLCSCKGNRDDETTTPSGQPALVTATIAYNSDDGFNPFTMKSSLNKQLISLIHRSLYTLDSVYMPVHDLASAEVITGTTVEIALCDAVFSNGDKVTAADVVYSFNQAKSSPLYSSLLSGYSYCEEKNSTAVIFTLYEENVNALYSLVFPIVKNGTADNSDSVPTGCGSYIYNNVCLQKNKNYDGTQPRADAINLVAADGISSLMKLLEKGTIDFCFSDLSGNDAVSTAAGSASVYLNSMIYLGVNFGSQNLASVNVRKAVSAAIDRRAITESILQGNGRPASVPFNTSWKELSDCKSAKLGNDISDTTTANKLLEPFEIGTIDEETEEVKTVTLSLIYPDSNSTMIAIANLIKEQLAAVNIDVDLQSISSDEYLEKIQEGYWDLYIAEMKIPENMDVSPLLTQEGSASYGNAYYELDSDDVYEAYLSGDKTLDDVVKTFLDELPFIPLCFRNGRFSWSDTLVSCGEITESRIYGTIGEWQFREAEEEN